MALGLLSNQLLERKQESPRFSSPHSKQKLVGVIGHDGDHQKKKKIVGEGGIIVQDFNVRRTTRIYVSRHFNKL